MQNQTATKYVAHRGFRDFRGLIENTIPAFEFAAKSDCWGIETDVHVTADGEFVVFHDDNTLRLCGESHIIEETNFDIIENLKINGEHKIPTMNEFVKICKDGGKNAVIELKNSMTPEQIAKLVGRVRDVGCLNDTTFISFDLDNVLILRKVLPQQDIQFLAINYPKKEVLEMLAEKKIDLDIEHLCLSQGRISQCHKLGIKVNCWTVNSEKLAKDYENWGIDFITSDNMGAELRKETVQEDALEI